MSAGQPFIFLRIRFLLFSLANSPILAKPFSLLPNGNHSFHAAFANRPKSTQSSNTPDINPDLYAAFGALPHDEQRTAAIEHFEVYGRKEGRKPVKPN